MKVSDSFIKFAFATFFASFSSVILGFNSWEFGVIYLLALIYYEISDLNDHFGR